MAEAEKYAVYYAMFYIKRNGYDNSIILSDSKSAINDLILDFLSKELNVKMSWVPSEINDIAHKGCNLSATKNKEFDILIFIRLSKKSYIKELQSDFIAETEKLKVKKAYIKELKNSLIEEIEKLKEEKERLKAKIKNQAVQIKKLQDKEMN